MRHNHDIPFVPATELTHKVGYAKPPQHSQFKPGESGNPRGRPRGSVNLSTLLDKALDEKVTVNEQGKSRKITKREAMATQLANRAAKGELAVLKLLLGREHNSRRGSDADQPEPQPITGPEEQEVPNYARMSTAELQILMEAAWIFDGKKGRPPIPMPPEDPGAEPDDVSMKSDDPGDKVK